MDYSDSLVSFPGGTHIRKKRLRRRNLSGVREKLRWRRRRLASSLRRSFMGRQHRFSHAVESGWQYRVKRRNDGSVSKYHCAPRISAPNTLRILFVGAITGASHNFEVTRLG